MPITWNDFDKIWAVSSPLTPYTFSDLNYAAGWNFIGSTPPARQMWDSLQKANDEKFKFLRDNFGTPNMATTAAEMTDTDKIYVYVGSEAGWNNGHWYYYDAGTSTWVDGGVYNSTAFVTDTTLTEAGKAADAKAVGDALALKADLAGATFTGNVAVNADFSTTGDATVASDLTVSGATTLTGNVTASGNVSVVGDIDADNITLTGDISVTDVTASGDVTAGALSVSGATTLTGNVTAGADITASGDVTANDASFANATLSGTLSVAGATTLDGLTAGSVSAQSLNTTGNASVGGTLTVSGATTLADITAGDITADDIIATGDISADDIAANTLTISGTTTLDDITASGDISANNITVTGDISADDIAANTLTVSGATTLDSVTAGDITANNVTVTGDISATNITASGDVSADDINANTLTVSGVSTLTGNITAGADITVTGDLSVNDITASGNITASADVTVTGDISANDITASGDITADDVTTNGNLSVVGNATLSGVSTAVTPAEDDNSTNIATTAYVQTEIKPIETDVTINDKRISNIEKLLQGNLYDYQTDTDSKYTKTVPNGAMPYASLDSVGGKTLVWNQLVDSGTTTVATISGHKYYTLIDGTASIVTADGTAISVVDDTADMVTDLTLCFGSGNEPSTTSAFQQVFPATHYSYNAGTLLSAGVTSVVSKGVNLFDISRFSGVTGITINGSEMDLATSSVINGLYLWENADGYNGQVGLRFDLYYYATSGYGVYFRIRYTDNSTDSLYPSPYPYNTWKTYTFISNQNKIVSRIECVYGTGSMPASLKDIQVSHGAITSYSAPFSATYPIPADIQALEGYGWSAGTVYNYVDFERKVFVQNVARIDLSTISWTYESSDSKNFFRVSDNSFKYRGELINVKYALDTTYSKANMENCTASVGNSLALPILRIRDDAYTDTTTFINSLTANTKYMYIELDTPVEVDISAYLTDDNLIEVEAGGTLSFPNSNGDDYRIDVPSSETYMVDLQEAI